MDNKTLVVDKTSLTENILKLKEYVDKKIIAVLKGDGYGLGIVNMATVLSENGIDFFAVSEYGEALTLREAGFSNEDILLLTPQYDEEIITKLIENNITLTVDSYENAKLYSKISEDKEKVSKVHIKVDTGFGRFGFLLKNKEEIVKALRLSNLDFEGIYSHFSCSFEKNYKITKKQFEVFNNILSYLKEFEFDFKIKHIANSCAALRFKETHLDAVRLGSALIGRLPVATELKLNKIGILESSVLNIKELPSGWNIGYANVFKTKRETKVAIIPVGYKDGFMTIKEDDTFRLKDVIRYMLNNLKSINKKIYIEINGKMVRLVGRVGMYNIVADVTGLDIKAGDKVNLNINPLIVNSNITRQFR